MNADLLGFGISQHRPLPGWPLFVRAALVAMLVAVIGATPAQAAGALPETQQSATAPARASVPESQRPSATSELAGRIVQGVRIVGNYTVSTAIILNVVRTREGTAYDPATVEGDIQRIYTLHKFSNVQANVEPTTTGVIVSFLVVEEREIRQIRIYGNTSISDKDLLDAIDIKSGQAIDQFRISMARQTIERHYREKNFPFAHVQLQQDALSREGAVVFIVIEGPRVRVRNIRFIGAGPYMASKLKDHIQTATWIWLLRPGTLDLDQVDQDVASLNRFYQSKGYFDVRVGRKIIVSPDQTEVEVDFVINEGPRYVVNRIVFQGNTALPEVRLRQGLNLVEGRPFDNEMLQTDLRRIIRDYSPLGYIYQPQSQDPDYLRIGRPDYPFGARLVFQSQPGRVDLVYEIHEGKPFYLGRFHIKGNQKTQDKVILREMRMAPGQRYDSAGVQDATDRLRATPYFSSVTMTPIGSDPDSRDLLVEVTEKSTASFNVGAGVSSDGGIGGDITYIQQNFDIGNPPYSLPDLLSGRPWTGAGQVFRASLRPGTQQTSASLLWHEPYLFDQPYSLTTEGYLNDYVREHWDEDRLGGRISIGKRFDYTYSLDVPLRGEDVNIRHIEDPHIRAPQIRQFAGHNTITSAGLQLTRDTVAGGLLPYRGSRTILMYEQIGALGGEFDFPRFTLDHRSYFTLYEDLLDRRTILMLRADAGVIPTNDAPFFERFYAGGLGSVRGFRFRGITPRAGRADDPVGGNFMLSGTAEVSYPFPGTSELGNFLRGVTFIDAGTVEQDVRITTIRTSIGAGVRVMLPFFNNAPLAIDFAYPLTRASGDDTFYLSFSLGVAP